MFAFRFLALVCAASAPVLALIVWPLTPARGEANSDFLASGSLTLLPDLTPSIRPARRPSSFARIQAAKRAALRLAAGLTPEMRQNFDLFVYVSKAEQGPLAQRMIVFRKQAGDLETAYDWAASTGREQREINVRGRKVITATPRGYYQIDPRRMYRSYRSASWNQDMPNTLFFDREQAGVQTGLAIHAASGGDITRLGKRASAGCVHLAPENAARLFDLVHNGYRGMVPRFAYDPQTQTRSNQGTFMRDRFGRLQMADGYRVLVVIDDYGGDNRMAALL